MIHYLKRHGNEISELKERVAYLEDQLLAFMQREALGLRYTDPHCKKMKNHLAAQKGRFAKRDRKRKTEIEAAAKPTAERLKKAKLVRSKPSSFSPYDIQTVRDYVRGRSKGPGDP